MIKSQQQQQQWHKQLKKETNEWLNEKRIMIINRREKNTLPPFALFRLTYRYGLLFVNIFLFSYCCSFAYF